MDNLTLKTALVFVTMIVMLVSRNTAEGKIRTGVRR